MDFYGTGGNPISQSDYWMLASADRWYGGYVEGLGYVAGDTYNTQDGNYTYHDPTTGKSGSAHKDEFSGLMFNIPKKN